MTHHLHLTLTPTWPAALLYALAALSLLLTAFAAHRRSPGTLARGAALAMLLLALLNPSLTDEKQEPLKDTALIVVDDSASMKLADRAAQSAKVLQGLTQKLATFDDLTTEILHVTGRDSTNLFHALTTRLADIPRNRLAGIILLSDGQIHDIPRAPDLKAPLHLLLAGHPDDTDRRLSIPQAPSYGIVGQDATLTLRVDDDPKAQSETADVTLHCDDGTELPLTLPLGKNFTIHVPIAHPGPNLFAFTTTTLPHEITAANNAVAATIHGVRDRLRVVLISGEPHAGERVWRNLLKSDPAVDLVHFTILRSPDKPSMVPSNQMALIPFPVDELFNARLASFDLVILDRFQRTQLIPPDYLDNIAAYVENGGALLIVDSTADDVTDFLSATPLARVLPVDSTHTLLTGAFIPGLTETGRRHPVTATLDTTKAGPWFRQRAASTRASAVTLMTGLQNQPLLVLNHVGKGRIAEFTSDQFWLWARHYEGGGPQAELLRRTAHWLMREPELDETALTAHAEPANDSQDSWNLLASERTLGNTSRQLDVTTPDGTTAAITLAPGNIPGILNATLAAKATGLYRLRDGNQQTLAMVGANGAPEFTLVRASDEKLAPLIRASGGGIMTMDDHPEGPDLRRTTPGPGQNGWSWIGLQRNGLYRLTGSQNYPLGPALALAILLLVTTLIAWWREGRNKQD